MMRTLQVSVFAALYLAHDAGAMPQGASGSVDAGVPTLTVSTAVASPTVPLNAALPSQQPLAPKQAWCPSEIFCAGPVSCNLVFMNFNGIDVSTLALANGQSGTAIRRSQDVCRQAHLKVFAASPLRLPSFQWIQRNRRRCRQLH